MVELWSCAKQQQKDLGEKELLAKYADMRAKDFSRVELLTNSLVGIFSLEHSIFKLIRNVGLLAFDCCPGLKKKFVELTSYGSQHGVGALLTRTKGSAL